MNELERRMTVSPAYDRRNSDPDKNYGYGSATLRMILVGPKGAVHFAVTTGMYLPHVERELFNQIASGGAANSEYNSFRPRGFDIGYHSYVPMYEGQSEQECDVLESSVCYSGGSTIFRCEEWMKVFITEGSDAIWKMLEDEYEERFENYLSYEELLLQTERTSQ